MDLGIKIWPLPQRIRSSRDSLMDTQPPTQTDTHHSEGPKKEKCLDQSAQTSNQRKHIICISNRQGQNERQMEV